MSKTISRLCVLCVLGATLGCARSVGDQDAGSGVEEAQAASGAAGGGPVTGASSSGSGGASCGADVSTDPDNCGACGHDCSGGACVNASCQPVKLAEGLAFPNQILVDGERILVSTDEGVMTVPIGGGAPVVFAEGLARGIAIDDESVYWADVVAGVFKAPLAGGSPTTLATSTKYPWGIAIDDIHLYWADSGSDGGIMRVAKSGGDPQMLAANGPMDSSYHVGLDVEHAYWATSKGQVLRKPKSGGNVEILAAGVGFSALTMDASFVYAFETPLAGDGPGAIVRVPLAGGEKTTLFSQGDFGWLQLAVDEQSLYWTTADDGSGTVVKMALGGGPATILFSSAQSPNGVTVHGDDLYWTDIGAGTLMKIRK